MKPQISVIVPVKNGAEFILEALKSVAIALNGQSYEIIIINDGSSDGTETILQTVPQKFHYFTQKSLGPAAARNLGLEKSQGELIAFIDADDVWTPNHYSVLTSQLFKKTSALMSLGYSQRFKVVDEVQQRIGSAVFLPSFGCGLFKREVFEQVGLLDSRHHLHEDVDWYLRALEIGIELVITKEVVKYYRLHNSNTTRGLKPNDTRILKVLATSLKRRKNTTLPALKEFEV